MPTSSNRFRIICKQTQNNVSLETTTEPLPEELCKIVPQLRRYLKKGPFGVLFFCLKNYLIDLF